MSLSRVTWISSRRRLSAWSTWLPLLALAASSATAATFFIRPDGGAAARCTGLVDAPDPGAGTTQPCAWDHPFQALPPGGAPRIAGGDTVRIAPGSYRMGFGAPGAGTCDAGGAFDCFMLPLPSGLSAAQPTRFVGTDALGGCATRPELWGAERTDRLLNLDGSSHVEIACLELTDHSDCIEFHNQEELPCASCVRRCERDSAPYGDWAAWGLFAADSTDVRVTDVAIHGLAAGGVLAGRLADWTLERVRIVANGSVGWNGDLGGDSSSSGEMIFRRVEIAWNGCAESWPADQVVLDSCWAQQAGGYGDGVGLADSAGHWLFEDCRVHHNSSDGLDLLYLVGGSSVTIRRLDARGNAGNQVKLAGGSTIENSVVVGDCAFFDGVSPLMIAGDHCRAYGAALAFAPFAGDEMRLNSSTVAGQGDCLFEVGCRDASCDGSESLVVRNTLFAGDTDWGQPWENSCLGYIDESTLPADPTDIDYSLIWQAKNDPCPGVNSVCGQDPLLFDSTLGAFDAHLAADSPAIDAGEPATATPFDANGRPRVGPPEIGAFEYGWIFGDGFEGGDSTAWATGT